MKNGVRIPFAITIVWSVAGLACSNESGYGSIRIAKQLPAGSFRLGRLHCPSMLTHPLAVALQNPLQAENSPNGWKEFSPPDGSFSILFPGIPKADPPPNDSTKGGRYYTYSLVGGLAIYWITYFDSPTAIDSPDAIRALLQSGCDNLLKTDGR